MLVKLRMCKRARSTFLPFALYFFLLLLLVPRKTLVMQCKLSFSFRQSRILHRVRPKLNFRFALANWLKALLRFIGSQNCPNNTTIRMNGPNTALGTVFQSHHSIIYVIIDTKGRFGATKSRQGINVCREAYLNEN